MTKRYLCLIFVIFLIDQISKFVALKVDFDISYNQGISFNFLSESITKYFSIILLIFICFLFFAFQNLWKKNYIATGFFFGGAFANLFDRIIFGAVRDWLTIPFIKIQNNFADWFIFIGLFILVFDSLEIRRAKIVKNKKMTNVE